MAADSLGILNRAPARGARRRARLAAPADAAHRRPRAHPLPQRAATVLDLPRVRRPLPETEYRIDDRGPDVHTPTSAGPSCASIVEADSWRWHGGRSPSESDRDRDQLLALAGWRVVRFTRDQILHRREETRAAARWLLTARSAARRHPVDVEDLIDLAQAGDRRLELGGIADFDDEAVLHHGVLGVAAGLEDVHACLGEGPR